MLLSPPSPPLPRARVHLSISPGCGHSGFEDHWQSDQYHYVHHAKFECNYGSPMSACIDQYFGTFREGLGKSDTYTGAWTPANDDNKAQAALTAAPPGGAAAEKKKGENKKAKEWSPHGYLGLPATWDAAVFNLFTAATALAAASGAAQGSLPLPRATALAAFVAYVAALAMTCAFSSSSSP